MRIDLLKCLQLKPLSNNKQVYLLATVADQNKFILNHHKNHWLISVAIIIILATTLSKQII